jgi:ATP-dependent DNA helicase RecG
MDRIEVLSFPGPLPPLKIEDLNTGTVRVRTYRNRRIGDFLKELHLTEGRCTGVPKIRKAMETNGSPPPIFKTDDEGRFFLAILPIHPQATPKTHQLEKAIKRENLPKELAVKLDNLSKRSTYDELKSTICELCAWQPLTAKQLAELLNKKDKKHLVRQYLTPLVQSGFLKYVYPERGSSPNQAYSTK